MRMKRLALLLPALLAATAMLPARGGIRRQEQARASATGLILGQVVDAGSEQGVGGAIVVLSGGGSRQRALSTADGYYVFGDLPTGTYSISAPESGT
jgi:Carboxypeptidase regulatory-like domain